MTTERCLISDDDQPDGGRDRAWLGQVVQLAVDNVDAGGGPFGALVVRDGSVVATGTNRVTTDLDPTAHAEIVAVRAACRELGTFSLEGCVLAASCEPCPMCLATALWSRVEQVVYAADRYDAAQAGFDDLAFYETFATPREEWTVPVRCVAVEGKTAPFSAWLSNPDRVDY